MEVCSKILCIKYLFKYCYEGHDCARIKLTNMIEIDMNIDSDDRNHEKFIIFDEIQQHLYNIDTRSSYYYKLFSKHVIVFLNF